VIIIILTGLLDNICCISDIINISIFSHFSFRYVQIYTFFFNNIYYMVKLNKYRNFLLESEFEKITNSIFVFEQVWGWEAGYFRMEF
jgi:hypothetical protein